MSISTPMLVLSASPSAQAVAATNGAGRLVEAVDWFQWGAEGTTISNAGLTRTQDRVVGGQTLSTTCSLGAIGSAADADPALRVYSPGAFEFDTFDDLYNSGSSGPANTLDVALVNATGGDTVTFSFSCSVTIDGTPVPIAGLIMADAESNNNNSEFVSATIPAAATWRIVDRFTEAGCPNPVNAVRDTNNRLTLFKNGNECGASAVAFMDGATSATVQLNGGGLNAIALGVVVSQDHGDAPASYGDATHELFNDFTGGTIPAGVTTNISEAAFPLAVPVVSAPRLGAGVDPESTGATSAAATGDDVAGSAFYGGPDDEDSLTVPSPIPASAGAGYNQSVSCVGTTFLAGWLDWNDDGDFLDTGERTTNTPACAGGTVSLAWTVPAGVVTSSGSNVTFLRVRTAASAPEIADPTGVAITGEAEDYAVNVAATGPPLDCSGIYALQGAAPRNILAVDPSTGVLSTTGSAYGSLPGAADGTAANALGISDDGTKIYSVVASSANPSVRLIEVFDRTTGTVTQVGSITIPTGTLANVLYGAVNPRTGVYYFGGITGTTVLVYGFDPATGTVLGQVASGTLPAAPGSNGDIGFDNQNNFYVVASGTTSATVYSFDEQLPTTAGTPVGLTAKTITTVTDNASTSTLVVGLAFGGQGSRRLYLAGPSNIRTVNPSTGVVESTFNDSGALTSGVNDLASCSSPNTLQGQVSFPSGRAAPADQATVTITGGDIAVNNGGTTAGSDAGLQDTPAETAGPLLGLDGVAYTVTQSGLPANRYATTYSCTDLNTDTVLSSGSGNVATFTMPSDAGSDGTAAYCLFTNTALVPAITLDKVAGTPTGNRPGSTVPYTFVVTNTGNVALSSVSVADPKLASSGGTVSCPPGALAIGATTTCTATYTLTQADVNAGQVVNTATATGISSVPGLPNPTATDANTLTVAPVPAISLVKSATPNPGADLRLDAGDTITYSFLVSNTGNVTLSTVGVTDAKVGAVNCPATTLDAGASTTCTAATYTVTQGDVNAGTVNNTATASGSPPTGPAVTATSSTSSPTYVLPALSIDKQVGASTDVNGNSRLDAGDRIAYSFVVTNVGTVTIANAFVTDLKVGAVTCPPGALAPGTAKTCSATYTVTQADVDSGSVLNSATATGTPPNGEPVTSPPDTTATPTGSVATLVLDKRAGAPFDENRSGRLDAGDTIAYQFVVTNNGAVTLTNPSVADLKTGPVSCPAGALAPGDSVTCQASYVLTQADVDQGEVRNTATAAATRPGGATVQSGPDSTLTPISAARSLTLDKQAAPAIDVNGNSRVDAGDTIAFSFLVTNTGAITLTSVQVDDAKVAAGGGQVTCPATTLAPGASTTCTTTYVITQTDTDSGSVVNTATATGLPLAGPDVTSGVDSTTTPTGTDATLTLDKSAAAPTDVNRNGVVDAGDTIAYSFLVTNTGAVTLTAVRVDDPMVAPVTCPVTTLAPGASVTCTKTYPITQADVDAGSVTNTATASGAPPTGPRVDSSPDSTSTPMASARALTLDKQAGTPVDVNGNGVVDAGDRIAYRFVVTNTGNVTLTAVTVTDTLLAGSAGSGVTCPVTSLAPRASTTCTGTYTITQADVDAGAVDNTATAGGTPPTGAPITSTPDSTTTPTAEPVGAIALDKQASDLVDTNGDGAIGAGDSIDYTFTVTNIGEVPLAGVEVDDPLLGAVDCPSGILAVGASLTCSKTYVLTSGDVAAGSVANTATVGATTPSGIDVVSSPDSTQTLVPVAGTGLTLDKNVLQVFDRNGNGLTDPGDEVSYEFVLTNTGEGSLTGLSVSDPMLTQLGIEIACPKRSLAPGETMVCVSGRYTITAADASTGELVNTATVAGLGPDGEVVAGNQDVVDVAVVAGAGGSIDDPSDDPSDGPSDPSDPGNPAAGDGGTLPNTGNGVRPWMPISGGLLVGLGLLLVMGARRRVAARPARPLA